MPNHFPNAGCSSPPSTPAATLRPSRKVFTASLNSSHQTALDLASYYTKLRCVLAAISGREVTCVRHSFSIKATRARLNRNGGKKYPPVSLNYRHGRLGETTVCLEREKKDEEIPLILTSFFHLFYFLPHHTRRSK